MNKDLAGLSANWRALFGVRGCSFCCLFVYFVVPLSKSRRSDLRRIIGPSLETGTVFDTALSGNYCAICDCLSVTAVREKCDEKGRGEVWESPSWRRPWGTTLFAECAKRMGRAGQ